MLYWRVVDCGKENVSAEVEMYSTDQEDEAEMERERKMMQRNIRLLPSSLLTTKKMKQICKNGDIKCRL